MKINIKFLLKGNVKSTNSIRSDFVSPYSNAGFISTLSFSWMSSLISLGNKKTLNLEDIPQLNREDKVNVAFPVFKNKLDTKMSALNLFKALILSAWKEIFLTGFLALLYTFASFVGPYFIGVFVQCLKGEGAYKNKGYLLASAFLIAKIVEGISQRFYLFKLNQIGIRIRSVLVAMIYKKGTEISCQFKQGFTYGETINFMAVDAERIGESSCSLHDPWLLIFQVGLALLILYKNLGLAALSALLATIFVMLVNCPLVRLEEKFQGKLMEFKDKRMKATSEILRNMRILKLYAWEMKFFEKITQLRKIESKWLKNYVYTWAIVSCIFSCASSFVSLATFGTCILTGIPLDSGKILSAIAIFEMLQQPITNLPETISIVIQTKVSLHRISAFLCLDDMNTNVVEKLSGSTNSDTSIEIEHGTFSWDLSASSNPTLKDINLQVFHGMKVALCGTVGCGKSSLLSCILGEVPKISGSVKLCGKKAYVAQSPWMQSGTIEENILFGKEMDRERYERILKACSLKKDLKMFSFGDQTVVGERGTNLSGGQKQRIQIARALYQDADIYLFDDPFSAVDAHTGSHLFKEVLFGLLSSKTAVYVTHQVEFLPAADLILVMKDGRITQAGKYNDILNSGSEFMELVGAHNAALSSLDSKQESIIDEQDEIGNVNKSTLKEKPEKDIQNSKPDEIPKEKKGQIIQEEKRRTGKVGFPVYRKYLTTAYGGALVPFILLAHILFQTLQIGSHYWMAWATPMSKDAKPVVSDKKLILVYAALAFGSSIFILFRSTLFETTGYKTATLIFNKMNKCIFHAPMSFFDATPSGRILNRSSTNQSEVDLQIPFKVWIVAFSMINLMGMIAVMFRVAWQVFAVFIPLISVCIYYQNYYISTARELSRLVGICRGPVIQHFAETMSGLITIRSFDQQSRFQELNVKLTDEYSRPKFYSAGAVQWLGFRLDMFSFITFGFCLFFLISFPRRINPAIAGLAVTYGLRLNTLQAKLIWSICNLEYKMVSVERIFQYMSIPSEAALVINEIQLENSWPTHGEIDIANLQVRYAPHLPLVLRGITCTFQGGKKTGIVGRTGCGKSTLAQTLFRIVEPSTGQIFIDGINISMIGLHDLRSRLSIIPQDPIMFDGTIRSNLDPLELYTDQQIWEVLDKCQLGDEVRKKEKKLDSIVTEDGGNWSMGQRQLVSLGRVLLKKSKVLVLDEATASVDTATDNLIQQTISQNFSECTVITIAHRITSILDCDMALLLNHGLIEEYDSPRRLLANKSSSFAKLVAEYTKRSKQLAFEKSELNE